MKTLLAHEWIATAGGSENVFAELSAVYPSARRVCLWSDDPVRFRGMNESWLARTPLRRHKAAAVPFIPGVWKHWNLADIDRIVASSHAFSHHLATRGASLGIPSFAYIHTPARYVWTPEFDERGSALTARAGRRYFQSLDRSRTSSEVSYAANSRFIRDRIASTWNRDSRVIYPPVDVSKLQSQSVWGDRVSESREQTLLTKLPDSFVLGASRLVEYKRLDLAIRIGEFLDLPVVIAGSGPYEGRLRDIAQSASVPVHFTGRVSSECLYSLYQAASLFSFMAVEDFGIMPVEAMAVGTPTIVNDQGGARESVDAVRGGSVVTPTDYSSLKSAAERALGRDMSSAIESVRQFDTSAFRAAVTAWSGQNAHRKASS